MWTWIVNHTGLISALASVGMMVIWLTYLQLLYQSFTRARRTMILINRGIGDDLDARCVISNMSPEPIYVLSILVTLHGEGKEIIASLTDFDIGSDQNQNEKLSKMNQGPLSTGRFMEIGTFNQVMDRAAQQNALKADNIETHFNRLDLTVVAAYGPEDLPVGASRSFTLRGETAGQELIPQSVSAKQVRSTRERKKLDNYVARDL